MKTTAQVRSAFLDFFVRNGHALVSSSPLVPRNDPTLLFTTAGMVQFKDLFTGTEARSYTRATTSQKCLRAGGKHNDLENVGFTARHHTFFEMLGNFSFGDYFKEEAIFLAWKCVTEEYNLPKDRLLVTVYSEDEEAAALWRKIAGFSDDRVIRIPTSDNFWSMGDTGPCGPCTEIFYDHGPDIPGGPPGSDDADGDRFIEIWNLVFMQFEQHASGSRLPLPKPSVDTGMGLERITTVLQGTHNNYEIDLFKSIIKAAEDITGIKADGNKLPSFRVVADHLRAVSFLIADGVLPANEGRGYVLRRILRRGMRHAQVIGANTPVMSRLVSALIEQMGTTYPELNRAEALIRQTIQLEEERFRDMLDRGLKLLTEETRKLSAGQCLAGDVAFRLYDTFGFPLDLTQDALRADGISVDVDGFNQAMVRQRQESRAKWSGSGEAKTDQIWFDLNEELGATEFLGYDALQAEGQIQALLTEDFARVPEVKAGDSVFLLSNQTPFYGESGGQMGDTGVIETIQGSVIEISDTQKKLGKLHVHYGRVVSGAVKEGASARFKVNMQRRHGLRHHHSATHLLHSALRKVLGDHVTQKGSLVAPDRLRFDFSHPLPLTAQELKTIEQMVNDEIRANHSVTTRVMPSDQAIDMGAMALFGEKYGDEVRVVSMGSEALETAAPFSLELCGGTHVTHTGDIGMLRIVSEIGVSAGVRRIEAVAAEAVEKYVDRLEDVLMQACHIVKSSTTDLPLKVRNLAEERKKLENEVRTLRNKLLQDELHSNDGSNKDITEEILGVKTVFKKLHNVPNQDVRAIVDKLKTDLGSGIVVVANTLEDKVALMIGVTPDLNAQVNAVHLIQAGGTALGGKGGGGRPDFAQGGGPKTEAIEASFSAIKEVLNTAFAS